eukprot:CAMPEP_0194378116 /NCGR_PEP_ID=MMETSP0174-20130528/34377_1 /TAXON_ID=216777 /ORGANISM="Proboscia alata, Strain PI-D3" /LENGTH=129 /DNA_ID=CAMNT_0039159931 /DNA_START=16 /DNA_END=405 /DNA_ORIENTATION=+
MTLLRLIAASALNRMASLGSNTSPQLCLAGLQSQDLLPSDSGNNISSHIWFAVPKSKISRGKKRMKTTLRKRIKIREDIIKDGRTGEITLSHKLPFRWKSYLPGPTEISSVNMEKNFEVLDSDSTVDVR